MRVGVHQIAVFPELFIAGIHLMLELRDDALGLTDLIEPVEHEKLAEYQGRGDNEDDRRDRKHRADGLFTHPGEVDRPLGGYTPVTALPAGLYFFFLNCNCHCFHLPLNPR